MNGETIIGTIDIASINRDTIRIRPFFPCSNLWDATCIQTGKDVIATFFFLIIPIIIGFDFFLCWTATKSFDELLSLSVYCRDRINPSMFIYALSVVVIHRPDTRNLNLPSHAEMFPSLYMNSSVFGRIREESQVVQPGSRVSMTFFIRTGLKANNN